ncbi:MAG: hypothetical protein ABIQ82_09475 [Variovorax sp.]
MKLQEWDQLVDTKAYILVDTSLKDTILTTSVSIEQTVQTWGNGLAVRLTAPVARAAHLSRGVPITVEVVEGGVFLRVTGRPSLSLAQKLKAFDPARHAGEALPSGRIGVEIF